MSAVGVGGLPYPTPLPSDASTGFLERLRGILRAGQGTGREREVDALALLKTVFIFNLWTTCV